MDLGIELSTKKTNSVKLFCKYVIWLSLFLVLVLCLIVFFVQFRYQNKIITEKELDDYNIALVFGAGLKSGGLPSDILEDRLKTAIQLYQNGKVKKIILSGDNSTKDHQEVLAMKKMALNLGLLEDILLEDFWGMNTFASCSRLKSEFNLSKIILITQKYHLRRALYTCNSLGIDAFGIPAIDRGYRYQKKYNYREILASLGAFVDINLKKFFIRNN